MSTAAGSRSASLTTVTDSCGPDTSRPITTDTGPVPVQATTTDLTGKRRGTVTTTDAGTISTREPTVTPESTARARANLTWERCGPVAAT